MHTYVKITSIITEIVPLSFCVLCNMQLIVLNVLNSVIRKCRKTNNILK